MSMICCASRGLSSLEGSTSEMSCGSTSRHNPEDYPSVVVIGGAGFHAYIQRQHCDQEKYSCAAEVISLQRWFTMLGTESIEFMHHCVVVRHVAVG